MSGPQYHGWTHRPKELGGTDPIPGLGGEIAWCRLDMFPSPDQTVPGESSAAPAIEFGDSTNNYTDTFTVEEDVAGVPLSVAILEDGLYHIIVYVRVESHPTNGFDLSIVGGESDQDDNFNTYISPLSDVFVKAETTIRGGPDGDNIYAFVRQKSGNSSFVISSAGTWMEIHKLGSVVNP